MSVRVCVHVWFCVTNVFSSASHHPHPHHHCHPHRVVVLSKADPPVQSAVMVHRLGTCRFPHYLLALRLSAVRLKPQRTSPRGPPWPGTTLRRSSVASNYPSPWRVPPASDLMFRPPPRLRMNEFLSNPWQTDLVSLSLFFLVVLVYRMSRVWHRVFTLFFIYYLCVVYFNIMRDA